MTSIQDDVTGSISTMYGPLRQFIPRFGAGIPSWFIIRLGQVQLLKPGPISLNICIFRNMSQQASIHLMHQVSLRPLYHRRKENIAIHYQYNKDINDLVRKIPHVRWSRTHSCWYTPLDRDHYSEIKSRLGDLAKLNCDSLKQYLQQRKSALALTQKETVSKQRALLLIQQPLSEENTKAFELYQAMIRLRGYSPNTFRT